MLSLIPSVKTLSVCPGQLIRKSVCYTGAHLDRRILSAIQKLPCDHAGTPLEISVTGSVGEGYVLDIGEHTISIVAEGDAGVFYAIQTLRQLFRQAAVQAGYTALAESLSAEQWTADEYRQEMLLAAEGICVIAELWAKLWANPWKG